MNYCSKYKNCIFHLLNLTGLLFCLAPACICAQPLKDTLFINSEGNYPVYKHLYIYKTDSNYAPVFIYGSVQPQHFFKLYPKTSYFENIASNKFYWILFTVKNNLSEDIHLYYQFNSISVDKAYGYKITLGNAVEFLGFTGYTIPFAKRAYSYFDAVFPLRLQKKETATYLLCINSQHGFNLTFVPELKDAAAFRKQELKAYYVMAFIAGIMLLVLLLNLFFGIALKERLHFLYSIYILIAINEIFTMQGMGIQSIVSKNATFIDAALFINPCLLSIVMAYIMQAFLKQKRSNSHIKIFVDINIVFNYFIIATWCLLFWKFNDAWQIFGVVSAIMCISFLLMFLLLLLSALEKLIQGYKPAWFYLIATTLFCVGLVQFVMLALAGYNADTVGKNFPNAIQIGIVLESVIVFLGIVYGYNLYKKEKEQLLVEVNIQQQNLINKIVAAEEGERKRIAEDLHDDVGGTLSALALQISYAGQYVDQSSPLKPQFDQSLALSKKALNDIRNVAHNLLPKDFAESGLFTTLKTRIHQLNAGANIFFSLIIEGDDRKLKEVMAISIYRIINELLTNITRHSEASEATVQLLLEESIVQIMVEDNGKGFDTGMKKNGIGIKNINRRIETLRGNIHIESNRGGTNVIIYIPYK